MLNVSAHHPEGFVGQHPLPRLVCRACLAIFDEYRWEGGTQEESSGDRLPEAADPPRCKPIYRFFTG